MFLVLELTPYVVLLFQTAPPAETVRRETRPLGDDSGEVKFTRFISHIVSSSSFNHICYALWQGTTGRAAPDIESVLREEVLQLSELVKEKATPIQFVAYGLGVLSIGVIY